MEQRNSGKIALPNGCYCSRPSVNPRNWKTVKASTAKPWYIQYRFYDKDQVKLVIMKGMNEHADRETRRMATEYILGELHDALRDGYNPILNKVIEPIQTVYIIDPFTPLLPALRQTSERISKSYTVKRDMKTMFNFLDKAIGRLLFRTIPISHVTRKHIKMILAETDAIAGNESHHRFNKFRSYLMMIFKELVELEVIENNPVTAISKKQGLKKIREVLSHEDRIKVDRHLKDNYYSFWRFMHIFFHSGCRLTEMVEIKGKDVNLEVQSFKVTIKKGKQSKEVMKPIKDIALELWQEAVDGAGSDDYIFSKGLMPGNYRIQSYQITKRWYRLVKQKIGITADFYSLKHLNLDQTAELLTLKDAAAMASHSSTVITMKHYAQGEEGRQMERLKKVNNRFI